MEEATTSFAPLLLVVFLAFLVPLLLGRFKSIRLPIVVGEILAGILIGRSGLGWVNGEDPVLEILSEFGFVFLMFLSGMEIDFSSLGNLPNSNTPRASENKGWGPIQIGGLSFLLTLALSVVIGFVLVQLGLARNLWMVALIMSTTSLGIVLPVLKERGLSVGRYGQTILVSALIADFATMLLITILVAVVSHGLNLEILLVGVLFVVFGIMYRLGVQFFNRLPAIRKVINDLSHATSQFKVRAAFTMMLIFVALSEFLGVEIILGAFLAGAIISVLRTPEDKDLTHQLEAVGFGFFIPIFFIKIGAGFNLGAIIESPQYLLLAPLLLLAALIVKFVPSLLFTRIFSRREALAAGALLSSRLSLIIAASAIGLRLGLISEAMNAEILLVAVVTVTLGPLLFTRLLPPSEQIEPQPVIVVGAGQLGLEVANRIRTHNEPVYLVDLDQDQVSAAIRRGFEAQVGDLENPDETLVRKLDQAKALICTYTDPELSYKVCSLARSVFGIDAVVADVPSPNDIPRFEQLDVTPVNAALDRATLLELHVRNPDMYMLLTRLKDSKEVLEIDCNNPACAGKALRQLSFPGDVLALALRRHGELIVPHGDTRIELGDHLTLVGSQDCIDEARSLFAI